VGNVPAFFSGHKQKVCVNIQAACDAYCRFQVIAVAGQGSMRDGEAIKQSGLLVANMDAAYALKTHSCPLIFGVDKLTA